MTDLQETAREIRKGILRTVYTQKQGNIGGPLSAADVLVVLYYDMLISKIITG
ncbi:hypothetical protein K8O68_04895 [Salipaludibacillus sp. CUR1]|uniref:hypothetical protein n=1 Tax=Salipaludibacillus sp. CUR1 TaxID=2820003 RepID=UPI001E614A4D|nr:hypothetical protein [Salipaludibacillus sp. CUR1]MCE7791767.1 hypothetical protein [Salipaludibacillus sp. CUR1]